MSILCRASSVTVSLLALLALTACGEGQLSAGASRPSGGAWDLPTGEQVPDDQKAPRVVADMGIIGGPSGGAGGSFEPPPPMGGSVEGMPDAFIYAPPDAEPDAAPPPGPTCGDDLCDDAESCGTCPQDCGRCPPICGDQVCSAPEETCESCSADCGPCPSECGDAVCDPDETCETCPLDCGDCEWPAEWIAEENAMIPMINAFRAEGANCGGRQFPPAGPVAMQPELRRAAQLHSQDMGRQGYFDHTSRDGRSPWQRMADAGYRGQAGGENIAAGNSSAAATFQQWVDSPGHCQNMMNGSFTEIGIGYAREPGSPYTHYWTQKFGR
ncbi:MAG: CAP domain-containing protein [Bradymonadia bacterium]